MSLFMNVCDQAPLILQKMQDQKLLMLRWLSFSRWGREGIAISIANKGGQYFIYGCVQPIACQITQDVRWKFDDTLLTLIFMMG